MKRRVLGGLVLVILLTAIGAYVAMMSRSVDEPLVEGVLAPLPASPRDAQYLIEGREVTLIDGSAEAEAAPGSAARVRVTLLGEPIAGDLNDDGAEDAAVVLGVESGGSGTFLYVAAALRDGDGYLGTNAILVGDRVDVSVPRIAHSAIMLAVSLHAEGQALTDTPVASTTKYYTVSGATLTDATPRDGETFYAGLLSYDDSIWSFTTCDGAAYTVASSSRSRAALEVVYAQRTLTGEQTSVLLTVVGADTNSAATSSEHSLLDVHRIVTAPQFGACE